MNYQNFYTLIAKLAAQEDVRSISCPFGGFNVWKILIEEQVKRATALGLSPQDALRLNGPDSGLRDDVVPSNWGGEVHIPLEGMCDGDIVFLPNWRVFHSEDVGTGASLPRLIGMKQCKYLFVPTDRDLGELSCATREVFDGWFLYTTK